MNTEKEKIRELINAYIDNELSERQHTEIKRLIDHDEELQEYYNYLIKGRTLIASLPQESAPESIAKFVINKIEREMILNEYSRGVNDAVGKKQLYMRNIMAVAAMIAMIAVLGFVILEIVGPSANPVQIVSLNKSKSSIASQATTYKLNMNTKDIADSTKIMSELIYHNLLESNTVIGKDGNHSEYKIVCTAAQAENLVRELSASWDKFQSPSLVIAAHGNSPVSVENISAQKMLTMLGVDAREGLASESKTLSEPVKPRIVSTDDRSIADKEQTRQIILTITIRQN